MINVAITLRATSRTTQAQRPGPRKAWMATGARGPGSLRAWLGVAATEVKYLLMVVTQNPTAAVGKDKNVV